MADSGSLTGSLLHILAHSDSLWLTLALSGAHWLTKFLLSSPHHGRVATVYSALVLSIQYSRRQSEVLSYSGVFTSKFEFKEEY